MKKYPRSHYGLCELSRQTARRVHREWEVVETPRWFEGAGVKAGRDLPAMIPDSQRTCVMHGARVA